MSGDPLDLSGLKVEDAMGAPMLSDEELAALQRANVARLDAYAEGGNVVNITGPYVACLADFLLPEDDPRRRDFAARWEVQLADMLDALDAELDQAERMAALTAAMAPPGPNRGQRRQGRR